MRAGWMPSGACTSGSIAPPRDATRRTSGGATTTGTTRAGRLGRTRLGLAMHVFRASVASRVPVRLGAALRRQRGGDDRLVLVHVDDGRDGDARRLDVVDGLDAHARADVARRRG